MAVTPFTKDHPYPPGAISYFSDVLGNIPAGFLLCDGNNGTPNLINTYAKSVPDGTTDPGATGGTNSLSLTSSQLPGHGHSASIDNGGSHSHTIDIWKSVTDVINDYNAVNPGDVDTFSSTSSGGHSHSFNDTASGSGSSINNEPLHLELAPIQRS